MICLKCGSRIDDRAAFCNKCGAPTSRIENPERLSAASSKMEMMFAMKDTAPEAKAFEEEELLQKKRNLWIPVSIAGGALLIAGGIFLALFLSGKPGKGENEGPAETKGAETAASGAVDPFAYIEVRFTGRNGSGQAEVLYSGTQIDPSEYSRDPGENLKNGDPFTVYLEEQDPQHYRTAYELIPESFEKTYEVQGLYDYITTMNELSHEAAEEIRASADQAVIDMQGQWSEAISRDAMDYLGCYLQTSDGTAGAHNRFGAVYRIKAHVGASEIVQYVDVIYHDILAHWDGVYELDLTDYQFADGARFTTAGFEFAGYPSLQELNMARGGASGSSYALEWNVQE